MTAQECARCAEKNKRPYACNHFTVGPCSRFKEVKKR